MSRWLSDLLTSRRVGVAIGRQGMIAVQGRKTRKGWRTETREDIPFDAPVFSESGVLVDPVAVNSAWSRVLQRFQRQRMAVVLPDPTVRFLRLNIEGGRWREEDVQKLIEHHAVKRGLPSGNVCASWERANAGKNELVAFAAEMALCGLLEGSARQSGSFVERMAPLYAIDHPASEAVQLYVNDDYWTLRLFAGDHLAMIRTGWTDYADWHEQAAEESLRYLQAFAGNNPGARADGLYLYCSHASENACRNLEENLDARGMKVVRRNGTTYSLEDAAARAAFSS